MISWDRVPMLRLLIPFILGICLGGLWCLVCVVPPCIVLVGIALWFKRSPPFLRNVPTLFLFFLLGTTTRYFHEDIQSNEYVTYLAKAPEITFSGEVLASSHSRSGGWNLTVQTHTIKEISWKRREVKLKLFVKDTTALPLPGILIEGRGRLKKVEGVDRYTTYLLDHGIRLLCFSKRDKVILRQPYFSLRYLASVWRNKLVDNLKVCGLHGESLQVSRALVLGDDDEISQDVRNSYADTGAIHILSVSGLHVGMIYLLLRLIFISIWPWGLIQRLGVIPVITGLILYAMITGLSPSVLRSTAMFVLFALANTWRRKAEPLNTLAVSAWVLLIWDPLLVYDIGFQLSYSAVVGILMYYMPIRSVWEPQTKLGSWAWDLCAVSISAQLTTFPMILFYFGKFPLLFLLVNLIVIPMSTVLLYAGLVAALLGWIPWIGEISGLVLQNGVEWMNEALAAIAKIPGASVSGLMIPFLGVWSIYGLLWSVTEWLIRKDPKYISLTMVLVLVFQITCLISQ